MDNVVSLFDRPVVTYKEFAGVALRADTRGSAQRELDRLTKTSRKTRGRIEVTTPALVRLESAGSMGALQPQSRDALVIATHENFPSSLVTEGMTKKEAVTVAATSVLAYSSLYRWITRLRRDRMVAVSWEAGRRELELAYPRMWSDDEGVELVGTSFVQSHHVLAHRVAARVALNVAGVSDFDPSVASLPTHIAALADPMTNLQVSRLYSVGNA